MHSGWIDSIEPTSYPPTLTMSKSDLPRRVVVTGMNVVTALGFDLGEFWTNIISGESGISRVPFLPDDSPLPTQYAGCLDDTKLAAAVRGQQIEEPDRSDQLALLAATKTLQHAGYPVVDASPMECDVIFGSGHGNLIFHDSAMEAFVKGGWRKLRPTTVVRGMFNRPANLISIRHQLTGTSFTVSAACATGSIAFGNAFNQVRFGLADRALAVCADAGLDPMSFSAWNRLGVLTKHPDPRSACRPFDVDRSGLVMGEGAAGFMLESLETAQARGANVLAEIAGYGTSSDASHIVVPNAAGQVVALKKAMVSAGMEPSQIDYVNAHGTATKLADIAEAQSLLTGLGGHGLSVPVSNTKAQLGHLMGATAGVELAVTLLAMQHGEIPPCRNLENPDPECPLNFVRNEPLKKPINVAMKNSFAFGGTNSVVVLKKFE